MADDSGPVVMLHGFSQNGRCLGPLAERLGEHRRVLTPDLPGHGTSAEFGDLDCPGAADHVLETVEPLLRDHGAGAAPAHWFGYSLGGRIALHLALRHPGRVISLTLLGATAGIRDRDEREARRALDHARADELERMGVAEFTHRWLQMDMFSGLPPEARFEGERRSNSTAGLAGSLRNAGTGSMEPLWDRLGELGMPVLLLSGELDHPFTRTAAQIASHVGDNATARSVPGAGHAAHLEAPGPTRALLEGFLSR